MKLDPSLLYVTIPLVEAWLDALSRKASGGFEIIIRMHQDVRHVREPHKLTARIYGTAIELNPDGSLTYLGAELKIERAIAASTRGPNIGRVFLQLRSDVSSILNLRIGELLDTSFDRQILYRVPPDGAP